MRISLIAGNWKMNTRVSEAVALVKSMLPELEKISNVEKVLCPPFVSLAAVKELLKASSVKLGAQNMFYEEKGAYTGEVSSLMMAELCEYVILGHSERRQHFNETNEMVNRKVAAALKVSLKPILCIGEKLEENEAEKTEEIVTTQLTSSLTGLDGLNGLVIAYEPLWAIGTGRAATAEQANKTASLIRETVRKVYGGKSAKDIRILYGGSVTAANIAEFVRQPEIDGALVGGASLKAAEFVSIVAQTATIRGRP